MTQLRVKNKAGQKLPKTLELSFEWAIIASFLIY
jgi:hypothetical protein